MIWFTGAVEGITDEAVLLRIIEFVDGGVKNVYGKQGKDHLLKRLKGYNCAAEYSPWFIIIDLNNDEECAPKALVKWLPNRTKFNCFRIAVREIESWLLADRERFAKFLSVPKSKIRAYPDEIEDPKQFVVELARESHKREVRELMVPTSGSGRVEGPGYSSMLIEFVLKGAETSSEQGWRPEVAATNSDSLRRCINSLKSLISEYKKLQNHKNLS